MDPYTLLTLLFMAQLLGISVLMGGLVLVGVKGA